MCIFFPCNLTVGEIALFCFISIRDFLMYRGNSRHENENIIRSICVQYNELQRFLIDYRVFVMNYNIFVMDYKIFVMNYNILVTYYKSCVIDYKIFVMSYKYF